MKLNRKAAGLPIFLMATFFASSLLADPVITEIYAITRGGKLYDNWTTVLKIRPPKETHPSYPATGKKQGGDTWRCKECHGWDYKGAEGIYAKGEHATGIKGIRALDGGDPARVAAILRDERHRYTPDMLSDEAVKDLALFVTKGQIDMSPYIDANTGRSLGKADQGAPLFQTICISCHGMEGKKINLGSEQHPEYLGTEARDNPQEVFHKIRNGQPGQDMINLGTLSPQIQADILAHVQTLPAK